MTMTTVSHRFSRPILGCAAALVLMICASTSQAQSVAVMVNGDPITSFDIEQRSKLNHLTTHKAEDRQHVVNELIDEKLKIKEGKKFGVDPTGSDIDTILRRDERKNADHAGQLTKSLEGQGIRPDTLKARIRAEMVWTSLVRGRYKESLQVGEKDVAAAVQVDRTDDKQEADSVRIQDAADRSGRPERIRARGDRGKTEGSRSTAEPGTNLRGGECLLQIHAKCRDTRDRDQDLGRHTRGST